MSNLTVASYRKWKGVDSSLTDAQIQAAIDAAEEMLNDVLGQQMAQASGTPAARSFVPAASSDVLPIDPCVSVTSVAVNGSVMDSSTYQLEPVGGRDSAGATVPYSSIRRLYGVAWPSEWGKAIVAVTADWGWTALPARYTEATKILTADLLDNRDVRNGVIGFTEYAGVRVKANPVVAGLVNRLRVGGVRVGVVA